MTEKRPEEKRECTRHGENSAYVDFEKATEEICNALMKDTEMIICELEKKKDEAINVQLTVSENCRECASEVKDFREYVITKINQKSERLLNYIEQHKNKSDTETNKVIDNIDRKLDFLKDFGKIARSKSIFEIDKNRLEQFKVLKNDIEINKETSQRPTMLNYAKCGDTTTCLSQLCGKIKLKEKQLEKKAFDISAKTTPPASVPGNAKRSNTSEETPAIDNSYKPGDAGPVPVPVVKDNLMGQSIASREPEESVPQPEKSPYEMLEWVNSLIAKAAKLFPRNTGVMDVTHGNNSRATDAQAAWNSVKPTQTVSRIVGCKYPVSSTTWMADSCSIEPEENSVTVDQTYHNMDLCIRPKNAIIASEKEPSGQSVNAKSSMAAQYYSDGVLQPTDVSSHHSEALYETPMNNNEPMNNNNNIDNQLNTSSDLSDEKSVGRSGDARDDEPAMKRSRLESEDNSTSNAQGPWKGKVFQHLLLTISRDS